MANAEMAAILAEFGKGIGIPQLAFDEGGYCCLFFDEIVVNLELDEETEQLSLYSNVGDLPEDVKPGFYEALLEANYFFRNTGGATLGIDRNARLVALVYRVSYPTLNLVQFERIIENFVNVTETWIRKVRELDAPGEAPAQESAGVPGLRI
jgi:hypothetical protein